MTAFRPFPGHPGRATGGSPALAPWLAALLLGAVGTVPAHATFTDATATAGVSYLQAAPSAADLAVYAGAMTAVDVDNDGWTDLVVARSDAPCLLFMNQGNGTFREESQARGLGGIAAIGGIAAGDFTNTGRQDLFLVPLSGFRCFLLVNDGTGHFTEQAVARGADLTTTVERHQGFSVSLVDYDRDGYLDIYLTEWGVLKSAEDAAHSALLHNRGAAAPGSFENRTAAAGLTQPRTRTVHYGFSAAWADFDSDGWPDLALIADFGTSQFFWNNGDGTFTEQGKSSGVAREENGMGVAVADYDGDGRLDYFASSIYDRAAFESTGLITGNKLYRHTGGRQFAETSAAAGVNRTDWSWGAAFFDYDNRGAADLIVTNGITNGLVPDPSLPSSPDAANDPTTLFLNDGRGVFTDRTAGSGIADRGQGRAVVVLDYDNDGDEDLLISNAYGQPILYRNDASANGNRWLRLRLRGTSSNRNGIGAVVRVTSTSRTRTQLYNPTNSFLGQHEPVVHFGLANAGATVDSVEILWPGGIVQTVTGLATNQSHLIVEPTGSLSAPVVTQQPVGGDRPKDQPVTLTVAASGNPTPVYVWRKNGVAIPGATGSSYTIDRLQPADAGSYTVTVINTQGTSATEAAIINVTADLSVHSVAGWWNRALLDAIRVDFPAPTIHARNLYHVSAAMWDAYWAYDAAGFAQARPIFHRETLTAGDWIGGREAAQRTAISYAAYRVLTRRYENSVGRDRSEPGFRWLMQQLGYDPDFTGTTGNSPAAVGNRIGLAVLVATLGDGANEAGNYADTSGYTARNDPLDFNVPGTTLRDVNHWQPLAFDRAVTQNGIELGATVQQFVGSNWRMVTPFALEKPTPGTIALDPGPPPLLGTETAAAYRDAAIEVIRYSSRLDPADGVQMDISPGTQLNNPLGTNNGTGHGINPVTNQPYAANLVRRGDFGRVMAEFWADGPSSETPPGHWNVLLNQVSNDTRLSRRFGGAGPVLSALEWDICAYVALNGAEHDAAIAAWTLKRQYDSIRPISMIRYLGGLGQSSDAAQPGYNAGGLPLVAGLVEVVTTASSAAGQRHAHLSGSIGKVAILSWRGKPANPATEAGGAGWILAERWMPYQRDTFVTPAFAGYISGHSTFSRAGAEVLTHLTGSAFFPGGLGESRAKAGEFLQFEYGPMSDVVLQWATYYDAADQAGVSRLWGGIHISADDFVGRRIGGEIGAAAFLKTEALRGSAASPAPILPPAGPAPAPVPTPTTPSTGTGGSGTGGTSSGGGGGAPSLWFLALLGGACLWRRLRSAAGQY